MDRSAIIIAETVQSKRSQDVGLLQFNGKPLVAHMVGAVKGVANEVIVVANSKEQAELFVKAVPSNVKVVVNIDPLKGSIAAALTGLEVAQGEYSLLLPFNTPFVSREVISLLFELCVGKTAVVPRRGGDEIEPLHTVYQTKLALEETKKALANNEDDLTAVVCKMRGVRYVSILVIEQLDPELQGFFRVKTAVDLKRASAVSAAKKKVHGKSSK